MIKKKTLHDIPLLSLKGVGDVLQLRLAKLNLITVGDLLLHLPLRYEDRTRIYPINKLNPALSATIEGIITSTQIETRKRKMLVCRVTDNTGIITMRFLHFHKGMQSALQEGHKIRAYGDIKRGQYGVEMIHPQYTINPLNTPSAPSALTPVYPTTEGISQTILRQLIQQALTYLERYPPQELLSSDLFPHLMQLGDALKILHQPSAEYNLELLNQGKHPAQQRVIIEELSAHHTSMMLLRSAIKQYSAPALTSRELTQLFLEQLPFTLTSAQQRVFGEIQQDLSHTVPMMRLIQGDVGSGKTIVAALSALIAIEQGQQVVLMAPTELLAEQHANNFIHWFTPLNISVGRLTGKLKNKIRNDINERISQGQIQMIIGTHAVFQHTVNFHQLGLVIIDEQHRFGVEQRLSLWEKGKKNGYFPHQLIMTATPIPRTLAMTFYADLDTSIIDELPPGRTPVTTVTIPNTRRLDVVERVKQACLENRQAYWVCTLIEESDILEAHAAEIIFEELKTLLPRLSIALIHGRMKSEDKQAIMQQFKQGQLQLLVATTVIEVGVDVPNASIMIIENPERLGLAQLHQLRGRVGRGEVISHCILLYQSPLSRTAQKRLQVLRESQDGFYIAEQDLAIRGAGEVLGTRQAGSIEFKIADLQRDQYLIPQVQQIVKLLLQRYPQLAQPLINRWLAQKGKYIHA